jgi:hypothetical protein
MGARCVSEYFAHRPVHCVSHFTGNEGRRIVIEIQQLGKERFRCWDAV